MSCQIRLKSRLCETDVASHAEDRQARFANCLFHVLQHGQRMPEFTCSRTPLVAGSASCLQSFVWKPAAWLLSVPRVKGVFSCSRCDVVCQCNHYEVYDSISRERRRVHPRVRASWVAPWAGMTDPQALTVDPCAGLCAMRWDKSSLKARSRAPRAGITSVIECGQRNLTRGCSTWLVRWCHGVQTCEASALHWHGTGKQPLLLEMLACNSMSCSAQPQLR